jgi:hypothetical protein
MLSGIGVISWVADRYNPAGHTPSRPLHGRHVSYRRLIKINHSIYGNGRKWPVPTGLILGYNLLFWAQRGGRNGHSAYAACFLSFHQHR